MKSIFKKKISELLFFDILVKIYNKIYIKILRQIKFKNYGSIKSVKSLSENGLYLTAIDEALTNKKKFNNFKSNHFYREVLEHVSYPLGLEYIKHLKKDSDLLDNINKFLINDEIGNPKQFFYDELNTKISPSTLRYMKIANDIKKIFKDEITNIIEIGCGYGGQYLILDQIMKINHYTLMDLYDVNKLIKKYLEYHLLNSSYETKTINQLKDNRKFDLVISNYAFSELPLQTQIKYLKKVLLNSKNGYLTMNSSKENFLSIKHLSLKEMKKYIKDIKVLEEEPSTAKRNYVIVWGNINTDKINLLKTTDFLL